MSKKYIDGFPYVTYTKPTYPNSEMIHRSHEFYKWMDLRRTVRDFSDKPVDSTVIENILLTASSVPAGAHKQPWTFCVVRDPDINKQIRKAAEKEEMDSHSGRMSDEWLSDLKLHWIKTPSSRQ